MTETATPSPLKAPFPYFGGKRSVSPLIWERFGNVPNYVEPFFGSGAVLLSRPHEPGIETVNDLDGMLANFWRALQADPDEVAYHADWPVNENDLHARHIWLVNRRESLQDRIEGDPDWYDAKAAGWWVWGACCWIGSGWCSGVGPWNTDGERITKDAGRGVNRQLPHLGSAGQGVNRQLPHLGNAGQGSLYDYFEALSTRLRRVRVCCGDWSRVCGPTPTEKNGLTGVFLDPPYAAHDRAECYAVETDVAASVEAWCRTNGDNPMLRIAYCGYSGNVALPGWIAVPWRTQGGYGVQGNGKGRLNAGREVVWFSPHCLQPEQSGLFDSRFLSGCAAN